MIGRTMRLTVNGTPQDFPSPLTVAGLIEHLKLDGRLVAVEKNREVVPRKEHATTALDEGDIVEVVHFVGGG